MRHLLTLLLGVFVAVHAAASPPLPYTVVARYAHPATPYTQGFALDGDNVLESSGLYRQSYVMRWDLAAQKVIDKRALPAGIFGEGLTLFGERIYVLSWREQKALVLDKTTLEKIAEFAYRGEGWGLTHNTQALIMSDGTDTLRFLDPSDFRVLKTVRVAEDGQPVLRLNELEWIPAVAQQPARILANIWQTDSIVAIDPDSGAVTARLDLGKLYPKGQRSARSDVLNGIAFDPRDNTLLVTGKYWPHVYRLKLGEQLR